MAGVSYEDAPWLHAMWADKPAAWFVRWELIGHAQGHVGEMVSVRDRLGYRPFCGAARAGRGRAPDQRLGAQLVVVTARRDVGPMPSAANPPSGTSSASA